MRGPHTISLRKKQLVVVLEGDAGGIAVSVSIVLLEVGSPKYM